jgi:hypothetical protein
LRKATLTSSLGSAGDWNRERNRRMWSVNYWCRNHSLVYRLGDSGTRQLFHKRSQNIGRCDNLGGGWCIYWAICCWGKLL